MNNLQDSYTFKRGLTLKNRVIMAPMTTKLSFYDGKVTQDELAYYHLRSGEVGAVITAAANVHENGKGWEGEVGVHSDEQLSSLTKLASSIQYNGTKAIIQLFHAGRMTNSSVLKGTQPVSASAVPAERPDSKMPRELQEEEIIEIIESFVQATKRAIKAGFDGVELHGANTYLIQQFFSPHSNRRQDKWGGSLEKRFTFINELVRAVLTAVDESDAENFIVGYRFSPEEFEEPGIRLSDTLYLVDQLADKGLDYLHISLRNYEQISISKEYQEKSMLDYIHDTINGRIPLIGVGDVRTKEDAEDVLKRSEFVALGRALLIDPHWTYKMFNGQENTIRTHLSVYDQEELVIRSGLWEFLEYLMPDRLVR